jgi:hypothetical protein
MNEICFLEFYRNIKNRIFKLLKGLDMLTKEKIYEIVDHLPEGFSRDDIIEQIIIADKIEAALDQFERGEFLTEEELDEEIKKW